MKKLPIRKIEQLTTTNGLLAVIRLGGGQAVADIAQNEGGQRIALIARNIQAPPPL